MFFLDSLSREPESEELETIKMISDYLWPDVKDVKVVDNFAGRLPQ